MVSGKNYIHTLQSLAELLRRTKFLNGMLDGWAPQQHADSFNSIAYDRRLSPDKTPTKVLWHPKHWIAPVRVDLWCAGRNRTLRPSALFAARSFSP